MKPSPPVTSTISRTDVDHHFLEFDLGVVHELRPLALVAMPPELRRLHGSPERVLAVPRYAEVLGVVEELGVVIDGSGERVEKKPLSFFLSIQLPLKLGFPNTSSGTLTLIRGAASSDLFGVA